MPANLTKVLSDVLTKRRYQAQVPQHGVRFWGAHIVGTIDLVDAEIRPEVTIYASRIDGSVNVFDTHFARLFSLEASTVTGDLVADGMRADGEVWLRNGAVFGGEVTLIDAKIGGTLSMIGSAFDRVSADRLNVAGALLMRNRASFKDGVGLTTAKIRGLLDDLRSTKAWKVDLSAAEAGELQIGGLEWWCRGGKPLMGARLALGDPGWHNTRCEGGNAPQLILRNMHAGALQDSAEAWPPSLDLEGFIYDRLGGFQDIGSVDMRNRPLKEWKDWLERDRSFSTQPYTQLSSVLSAAGHRDASNYVAMTGRNRERDEACRQGDLGSCAGLTALSLIAGYGIGLYTFRVLWWVIFFALLGVVVLHFSRSARSHSVLWKFGASLHRLLPIVRLSREFEDFFDNNSIDLDAPRNLNRIQIGYFAVHAIAGWVLGLILLAAMSGLTQKG